MTSPAEVQAALDAYVDELPESGKTFPGVGGAVRCPRACHSRWDMPELPEAFEMFCDRISEVAEPVQDPLRRRRAAHPHRRDRR